MQEVAVKEAGDTYTADEFNNLPLNELQNMVTLTGLTFDSTDLTQLSQAVTHISSSAREYQCTGAANTYSLSSFSPVPVTEYFNGLVVVFLPSANNTGATTLNVESLGAISLLDSTGSPLVGGELVTTLLTRAIYIDGDFYLINVISKDISLINNLADQTSGSEGSLLVGHTNTTVNNVSPRAIATVKFDGINVATINSFNGVNVISAEAVDHGITRIYFNVGMDTTDYIVAGGILTAAANNETPYLLKFSADSQNYVTIYTYVSFGTNAQVAYSVDFSIQIYESR